MYQSSGCLHQLLTKYLQIYLQVILPEWFPIAFQLFPMQRGALLCFGELVLHQVHAHRWSSFDPIRNPGTKKKSIEEESCGYVSEALHHQNLWILCLILNTNPTTIKNTGKIIVSWWTKLRNFGCWPLWHPLWGQSVQLCRVGAWCWSSTQVAAWGLVPRAFAAPIAWISRKANKEEAKSSVERGLWGLGYR